jgi:hypothetical protein
LSTTASWAFQDGSITSEDLQGLIDAGARETAGLEFKGSLRLLSIGRLKEDRSLRPERGEYLLCY